VPGVLVADVLKVITDYQPCTVNEIAEACGCGKSKVRSLLKKARTDGEAIYYNRKGYYHNEEITTKDDAEVVREFRSHLLGIMKAALTFGKNTQKQQLQATKLLKYNMSSKERKQLIKDTRILLSTLTQADIEMTVGD